MADDPLDEVLSLPIETQIAVTISVLRSTRNQLGRIEKKLDWVNRSIWALVATIVAGVAIYYLTVARTPVTPTPPAKTAPPRAHSTSLKLPLPMPLLLRIPTPTP